MAITETSPAPEPTAGPADAERFVGLPDHDPGGFAGFVGTGDHRALGTAYIVLSLLLGLGGLVLAGLFHANVPGDFLPNDTVGQIFTLSEIGLVLLFVVPLFVGIATAVVPLQVGANTIAFPRAAAAAFWGWLVGSGILIAGYAINGGPDGGGFKAVDLSLAAMALVIVSLMVASMCIVTTVIALRTPGLYLDRVPMFSWSMVVAGSLWLLSLPVLLGNILLTYLDHHYGTSSTFAASQWAQLSWAFGPPQVFSAAIPVLGVVGDVVATFAGVRQRHRGAMFAAVAAFGVLTFGAWVQPTVDPKVLDEALFLGMAVLIVVPLLAALGGWAGTLRAGKPLVKSPLLFSLSAGLVLVVAAVADLLFGFKQLQLHDSRWLSGILGVPPYERGLLLLVVGASLLAALGALVYWAPKVFGRFAAEGLATLGALAGLGGALLAGVPLLVYGFALKITSLQDSAKLFNGIAAAGVALMAVAVVLVALSLLGGKGESPADDAWGRGQSLEWATGSPPPPGNFGVLDPVTSAEPLLDAAVDQPAAGTCPGQPAAGQPAAGQPAAGQEES